MTPSSIVGTTLLNRYGIQSLLGEGIFGFVYLAVDHLRANVSSSPEVAIKVVDPQIVSEVGGLAGLAPQLSTACRINHPNICNIFDFHEEDGFIFVVMERLVGRTLRTVLDQDHHLTDEQRFSIVAQIIEGLAYAHRQTAFVRLNPSKIWLQNDGTIKIADLGLGNHLDTFIWANHDINSGQADYLAPEVLSGPQIPDKRADQFSLAVISLEVLTSSRLFRDIDTLKLLDLKCSTPQSNFIRRMLSPDSSDRFQDLCEAGQPFLERRLQQAKSSKPNRVRHRPSFALGLAAISIVTFVAGICWSFLDHQNPSPKAEYHREREYIDELLRRLDDRRMALHAMSLGHSFYDEVTKRFASARPELQISTSIAKAEASLHLEKDESKAIDSLIAIRTTLEGRLQTLNRAEKAFLAMERLETCVSLRDALTESSTSLDPLDKLDAEQKTAVELFSAGAFEQCTITASAAEQKFYTALKIQTERIIRGAQAARTRWTEHLEQRQLVSIEPIGEPSSLLENSIADFASENWKEALSAAKKAEDYWAEWTESLEAILPRSDAEYENSLGMRFRDLGDFSMSIWETRVVDFLVFVKATGLDPTRNWREFAITHSQGPTHPATYINHHDAVRFCEWLTQAEREHGKIGNHQRYRLPTDREWSLAVGLPVEHGATPESRSIEYLDVYPWGKEAIRSATLGNYDTTPNRANNGKAKLEEDAYIHTSPVGSFSPNLWGLYDMGGNVFEWVIDRWYTNDDPIISPRYLDNPNYKVVRGGSWRTLSLHRRRSSFRQTQYQANGDNGFRVVLASTKDETHVPNFAQ